MNPNDPPEFANLIKTIKKELPFFSKKTVSMKADHGQLPKNVRNHTIKLNEKFLDNNFKYLFIVSKEVLLDKILFFEFFFIYFFINNFCKNPRN